MRRPPSATVSTMSPTSGGVGTPVTLPGSRVLVHELCLFRRQLDHRRVSDTEPPVTAPGQALGAHHRGGCRGDDLRESRGELARSQVICVGAKARATPRRVLVGGAFAASASAELRNVQIADPRRAHRRCERVAPELRVPARTGKAPDVAERGDAGAPQQLDQFFDRSRRVADREDRGPHPSKMAAPRRARSE